MNGHTRPVLLGYIRTDALDGREDVAVAQDHLLAFAHREGFALGTVYVENGSHVPGAFEAVLAEIQRDESAWAVVVPDAGHLADEEQRAMRRWHHDYATVSVLVANLAASLVP